MARSHKCPKCQADGVCIIYGYPGESLMEKAKAGKVALGGCVIEDNMPKWKCSECGHEWGNDDEMARDSTPTGAMNVPV